MTRKVIFGGLAAVFALALLGWNLQAAAKQQKAEFTLRQDHAVNGTLLKAGKYLLVHEVHAGEHVGDACMFFYSPASAQQKNEVARLRCNIIPGESAQGFVLKTLLQPDGSARIQSVQFPGSKEVHELRP